MESLETAGPSVPGGLPFADYGSNQSIRKTEGAKNIRDRSGCHGIRTRREVGFEKGHKRKHTLYLSTYNVKTLSSEEKLIELETELEGLKWNIIGLAEVRRKGEACVTLKSGHKLYYRGNEERRINGVAFLINKNIKDKIIQYRSISERVIYIDLEINKRTKCRVIQAYAPTTDYDDEDIESFYEDLNLAVNSNPTKYLIILGDFNAKIGKGGKETGVGPFGLGNRNNRGDTLVNFICENRLFIMNSFFKKPENRRWTWESPDKRTRNEIDYVITNNKNIIMDTTVINSIKTNSDHRMLRAKVYINTKQERRKLIRSKSTKISTEQLRIKQHDYQEKLQEKMQTLNGNETLEIYTQKVTKILLETSDELARDTTRRQQKISKETIDLIVKRKKMQRDTPEDTDKIREKSKEINQKIRRDKRNYEIESIQESLENGRGLKNILRTMSEGKRHITKIKNENNELITDREQLRETVHKYYEKLYESKIDPPIGKRSENRIKVTNVGSEDIPEITADEIIQVVKKIGNGRAPGEDGVIIEMIKYGGPTVIHVLEIIYNKCLTEGRVPEEWNNALMVLLFKKGNQEQLDNYRPISLVSTLYKIFTKIITMRLANKLDGHQPREQAGFRGGFSTLDHLQAVRTLIEKANEYNITLWIAFIDYEKAFDSIETWAVLNALSNCRVDHRYTDLIGNIYENATFQVLLEEKTNRIKTKRGVRQGDSISPKLFTLTLEEMFKQLNWDNKGISIDGEQLHHLRFADDIILISETPEELQQMLNDLNDKSKQIGMKINIAKTKYMTNVTGNNNLNPNFKIEQQTIEKVTSYVYLGQQIEIGKNNLKADLKRRISLAWSSFGKLQRVFNSNLPNTIKAKVFNQQILPVLTYGIETWAMNNSIKERLQIAQRAMERRMLGLKLRDRIRNEDIRARSKVSEVIERACRLRWNWAGHVARMTDNRWTKRLVEWRPRRHRRPVGRPQTRWTDDIKHLVGNDWMRQAQDKQHWRGLGEAYIRRWMNGC